MRRPPSAPLLIVLPILLAITACQRTPPRPKAEDLRVNSAERLTRLYANSRIAQWNVRARAAGADCSVLCIETEIGLDDSMVEALHYGGGVYEVVPGGIRGFSRDRTFRGVAYCDSSGNVWAYDGVVKEEARGLPRCQ